jgi:hypothetical protein
VPAFAAGVAEGSEVAWADARTVTLRHPGSDTTQLTEQTRRRLVSEGWTVQIDTSTPNLGAMELHREEERLSVGVLPSRGATTVTLTLLGLAP